MIEEITDWQERNDFYQLVKEKREKRYLPLLEEAGAKYLSSGVYRLGVYDCYPKKGTARNWKTNKRTSIAVVLKSIKGDKIETETKK